MTPARLSLPVIVMLTAAACLSTPPDAGTPARIVDPGPASRDELQRVVSDALGAGEVMLDEAALTDSSWLVVERRRIRDLDNAPLSGRDLGSPERFRLRLHGDDCVLVHEQTGRRYPLNAAACVAE